MPLSRPLKKILDQPITFPLGQEDLATIVRETGVPYRTLGERLGQIHPDFKRAGSTMYAYKYGRIPVTAEVALGLRLFVTRWALDHKYEVPAQYEIELAAWNRVS